MAWTIKFQRDWIGGRWFRWRRELALKSGRMLTVLCGPIYFKWKERGE